MWQWTSTPAAITTYPRASIVRSARTSGSVGAAITRPLDPDVGHAIDPVRRVDHMPPRDPDPITHRGQTSASGTAKPGKSGDS